MNAAARLAGFGAIVALAFAGAALAGDAFGPEPDRDRASGEPPMAGHGAGPAPATVRGLSVASGGLRLVLETPELRRGARQSLSFRVVEQDGATLRDFEVEHEKRMHLILARRDFTGFQHLHPRQLPDGSWVTRARIPTAGSYRVFADFVNDGRAYTLASDLRVDGGADLRALPEPAPLARAGRGYTVRLDADAVRRGQETELRFTPHRDGRAVRVEPYLGAGGHLVALRDGDLAYLHVHPVENGHAADGGESIGFEVTFPTEGRYRLFLQFKHGGRVRTAAFTQDVSR